MFKTKIKLIKIVVSLLVLAIAVISVRNYLKDDVQAKQTIQGEKRNQGTDTFIVLYGQEIKKELETFGDLLIYEQEFQREFIYDQSSWQWMPLMKDAKKSIITNNLVMNKKYFVSIKELNASFDESEKEIIFYFTLKNIKHQTLKDVKKSGIDSSQTEKGRWAKELPTEITGQDEKKYQKEVEQTELSYEEHKEMEKQFIEKMTSIVEVVNQEKNTQKKIKVEVIENEK